MSMGTLESTAQWIRSLAGNGVADTRPDGELLRAFGVCRDDSAFVTLVKRHGPMVLGVCRRLLPDVHAAEDAFQATFLVLARKAASLRDCTLLAGWLYGVAYRVALQARRPRQDLTPEDAARLLAPGPGPGEEASNQELCRILDEEIHRLPARYRQVVVLCYLEGQTNVEAARRLGHPVGTVAGWLNRARARLRLRLGRRGIDVAPAALAGLFAADRLSPALGADLPIITCAGARALVAGRAGTISTKILTLYQGVMKAMLRKRIHFLAAVLSGLFAVGVTVCNLHGSVPGRFVVSPSLAAGQTPGSSQDKTKPPNPTKLQDGVVLPADAGPGGVSKAGKDQGSVQVKVGNFHTVVVYGAANVFIKKTGKESVTIKGDKKQLQSALANVHSGTLYLGGGGVPFFVGQMPTPGNPMPGGGGIAGGFNPMPPGGIAGGFNPVPPGGAGFNPVPPGGVAGGFNPMPGGGLVGNPAPGGGRLSGNPMPGGVGFAGNPAPGGVGFAGNPMPGQVGFAGNPMPGGGPGGPPQPGAQGVAGGLIEFHVEVKDLKAVAFNGAGAMEIRDLDEKQVILMVSGVGSLTVHGKASEMQVLVSGAGSFVGDKLKSARASVTMQDTGAAIVNVSDQLNATITGTGNIEYLGNPKVQKMILGAGKVVPKS